MKATAMDMMSIWDYMDSMPDAVFEKATRLNGLYGFGCIITHDYGNDEFSYETLWEIISQEFPSIRESLVNVHDMIANQILIIDD